MQFDSVFQDVLAFISNTLSGHISENIELTTSVQNEAQEVSSNAMLLVGLYLSPDYPFEQLGLDGMGAGS